ncbi:putative isomerase, 3-hydroxyacyl-CoA dehydrogenase, Enoyl-CoA hydratase [Helianthus debilis subsp. tardiflorus]
MDIDASNMLRVMTAVVMPGSGTKNPMVPLMEVRMPTADDGHGLCVDALYRSLGSTLDLEVKVFNELVLSDTLKGLLHIFFAQRAISKVPKVTDVGLKPRAVKKVAVIGGGLMGSGIATALILGNTNVVLKEVNSEYLQKGLKTVEANARGLVARKKLASAQVEKASSMIKGVLDYSEFRDVDMVIEVRL